ncbi:MAG: hypothetical protein ACFFG0_47700, partial [Candidatus Thorarchaeota archaeon]
HLEEAISEGRYRFFLEQKAKLKAFFKGEGIHEDPFVRRRLKEDLYKEVSHDSNVLTLALHRKKVKSILIRKLRCYKAVIKKNGKSEDEIERPQSPLKKQLALIKERLSQYRFIELSTGITLPILKIIKNTSEHYKAVRQEETNSKSGFRRLLIIVNDSFHHFTTSISQNKTKYAGIFLSVLGTILITLLLASSTTTIFLPHDIKFLFFLLQVGLAFFFFLFFNGWRILQRHQVIFLSLSFIPLPWVGYLLFTYGMMKYAQLLPLLNICLCYFVSRSSPEIIPKKSHTPLLEKIKNTSISKTVHDLRYKGAKAYHKNKFVILWTLLFFISIGFIGVLVLAPQFQLICYGLIFGAIFLLTFKSTTYIRAYLRAQQKERPRNTDSRQTLFTHNDKIARSALLVTVFLTVFPLIFAVNSISAITSPDFEFARVSQAQRLQPASIDFTTLEYSS